MTGLISCDGGRVKTGIILQQWLDNPTCHTSRYYSGTDLNQRLISLSAKYTDTLKNIIFTHCTEHYHYRLVSTLLNETRIYHPTSDFSFYHHMQPDGQFSEKRRLKQIPDQSGKKFHRAI